MEPKPSAPPFRILGIRIDRVTFREALARVDALLSTPGAYQVITGNTLMLLAAEKDPELRVVLEEAALVVPESSGISWACRWMGQPIKEMVPGIDLLMAFCHLARDRKKSIFLLGARPGVAETAAKMLESLVPGLQVSGTHHGFFREDEATQVLLQIRAAKPSFLFVALNVPQQEKWIHRHRNALGVPIIMGVGGSFDVLSGNLRRAPRWLRQRGGEWVFRLLQEPWRWRRIAELPHFVWKVVRERRDSFPPAVS